MSILKLVPNTGGKLPLTMGQLCDKLGCTMIDVTYCKQNGYFVSLHYGDFISHATGKGPLREVVKEAHYNAKKRS